MKAFKAVLTTAVSSNFRLSIDGVSRTVYNNSSIAAGEEVVIELKDTPNGGYYRTVPKLVEVGTITKYEEDLTKVKSVDTKTIGW